MLCFGRDPKFHGVIAFVLLSFSTMTVLAPSVNATMSRDVEQGTSVTTSARKKNMEQIYETLEREKVKEKLRMLGFTTEGIKKRLRRLSDREIQRMANRIEYVRAGGHLGVNQLSLALLIVFIILAPILAVAWVVLMMFGHEIHLHKAMGHAH